MKAKVLDKKEKTIILSIVILFMLIGISYAWMKVTLTGESTQVLKAGSLDLILDERDSSGISMQNRVPISDKKGLESEGYTFRLINKGSKPSSYTIYLDDLALEENKVRMDDQFVKYTLSKNDQELSSGLLSDIGENPNRVLDSGNINSKSENKYTLKLWISKEADRSVMGTVFYGKLRIEASQTNTKVEQNEMEVYSDLETVKIDLAGKNPEDYLFLSSDESIVTLSGEGAVTVVGPGTAVVTVKNKTTQEAEMEINVKAYVRVVAKVALEEASCLLKEKGQTKCKITLPDFTPKEGYEVVGWSEVPTSHEGVLPGEEYEIQEGTILYPIMKKKQVEYKAVFVKQDGVESISSETLVCKTNESYNEEEEESSCTITLPEIVGISGYTVLGWSLDANSQEAIKNTTVSINQDTTFYTIAKKESVTLKATFYKNGAGNLDGNSSEYLEKTCTIEEVYNKEQEKECEVEVPIIEGSTNTPNVIGFSENQDSIVSSFSSSTKDHKVKLKISDNNKKYYAITSSSVKTNTATFYKNGSLSLNKDTSDSIQLSCNIGITYNGVEPSSSCNIKAPIIEADSNTPIKLGFSLESDLHGEDTLYWEEEEEQAISNDVWYYAQTTNEEITNKVHYEVGANVVSIAKESDTCKISKTYNGVEQAKTCQIKTPEVIPKSGYVSVGFSKINGSKEGEETLFLSGEETYYANAVANSYTIKYYDGEVELGTTSIDKGESITLKRGEEFSGLQKGGYHFKGWDTSSSATTVVYQDGEQVKDITEELEIKLYAVWQDDIAPTCTFQTLSSMRVNDEKAVILQCIDEGSGVEAKTLSLTDFSVSNDNGSLIQISEPAIITGGYQYIITIKGLGVGSFAIRLNANTIKDNLNNKNVETSSQNIEVLGLTYKATFTKQTGAKSIGATSLSCTTTGKNTSCEVTAPSITAKSNYQVIGWSRNKEATATTIEVGDKIRLSENAVYYTATYQESLDYDSVRFYSGNSSAATATYDDSDMAEGATIDLSSSTYATLYYNLSGLNPSKVYKFSAHIKTKNLTSTSSSYGAVIGTSRYVVGFSNIAYSWSDGVLGTDEKDVDIFFVPDYQGNVSLMVGTPHSNSNIKAVGHMEFSNMKVEEATSSDVTIFQSKNKNIKMILRNEEYNKLNSLVTNKQQATQNFIDKLEEVYHVYATFAGQNSAGHGLLYPYRAMPEVFMYTNHHQHGALAGYPIEFNWSASSSIATYENNNKINWGELHELGHTFEEPLMSLDGYKSTNTRSERMWDFDGEFWANMKAMYAIDKGYVTTTADYFKSFENTYNTTLGKASNKTYNNDALSHLFMQTKDANGIIDWEAMQKTFKWFNDLETTTFITSNAEKYGWYIKKYTEYCSPGHTSIYEVLTKDANVLSTINSHFGYKDATSITLSNSNVSLSVGETYQEQVTISSGSTNSSVTYKSQNPQVVTVDDFGNIKAIAKGSTTITVYSFFNPSVAKTITVTVT